MELFTGPSIVGVQCAGRYSAGIPVYEKVPFLDLRFWKVHVAFRRRKIFRNTNARHFGTRVLAQ